tara:strand:+ start:165 stop:587 length:423 start_codon:yes stop_codon:yes gene_type:complete
MGYEIELSFNLKKQTDVTNMINKAVELANNNYCDRHYQFSEMEGKVRGLKRQSLIMVFCFESEYINQMSDFLKEVLAKYKRKLYIESIYHIDCNSLIYASPYYMKIMEEHQVDNYKKKRQNLSFSDTDYYILKEVLKKIK